MNVLEEAKAVLSGESAAISKVSDSLGDEFCEAVELILSSRGKVIVTGMGKSALIARKVSATMASTGTLAVFLHASDALHGDLGMVGEDDVVLALSKSGETQELSMMLPSIRKIGAKLISFVGRMNSALARHSHVAIEVKVDQEACPLDLAPTASTTAMLALGDALAITLMKCKGFQPESFALYHPGGSLGKRLLLTVSDLMHAGEECPVLGADATIDEVLLQLTSKKMGAVNIADDEMRLIGIITDGDLRRALRHREKFFAFKAGDIMTSAPVVAYPEMMAVEAVTLMEDRPSQIMVLPVVNDQRKVVGILRLHDIVRAGL